MLAHGVKNTGTVANGYSLGSSGADFESWDALQTSRRLDLKAMG